MLRFQDVHRMKLEYAKHMAQQKGSWNKNKIQEPFNVWWKTCEPPSIIPCLRLTFGVGPYLSPWFCTCEDGGTNLCKERKGRGKEDERKQRWGKKRGIEERRGEKGSICGRRLIFQQIRSPNYRFGGARPFAARCVWCTFQTPRGKKHDLP